VVDEPERIFGRAENEGGVMVWMSLGLFRYLVMKQSEGRKAESVEGLSEGLLNLRLVDRFGRAPSGGSDAQMPVFRDVVYERDD
jgi:hypothetical protein